MYLKNQLQYTYSLTKRFIKKNAPTILTFMGVGGLFGTTVLAVKATPKALDNIEKAREEKGAELTTLETVNAALPYYLPSIATGLGTAICIIGSNNMNNRVQSSLVGAYLSTILTENIARLLSRYTARMRTTRSKKLSSEISARKSTSRLKLYAARDL